MKYFKQVSKRCFAMLLTFIMAMGLLQTTAFAAAKWHTVTLVPASTNSYSSKITSAKVRVGQTVNGYEVTSVSGTTIKVKAWGDLYGDFFLPRAADLWNGAVKSDYVIWAGTGSSNKTEGGSAMLPQSNASAYYYFDTPNSVEGGGGGSSNVWNFTLRYDANGGSGAPDEDTYGTTDKYEKSHIFTISSTEPTRTDNYTFLGWSETRGASVASYDPGDNYLMSQTASGYNGGSVTKTLYAVWQRNAEKVTLTYDANGGINPPTAQTVDKGTIVTVAGKGSMTKGDDEFLGWSTDRGATTADWNPSDSMALNANTTLYAVWKTDNGAGIDITKTRASINGDASKTTAEPGDTITWNIVVTNNSNVSKTVTLTEQLVGASLSKSSVTLAPGASETVTATYTVKRSDKGTTIYNTVVGSTSTSGEDKTATDEGTLVPDDTPVQLWVKWVDEDGTVLEGPKYFDKGASEPAQTIQNPTKAEDDDYTYEFKEWVRTEDGDGNVTYTATYTATPKTPTPTPTKDGTWRLDIVKEISNYQNKGKEITVADLPEDFTVDVTVEYHNGTERVTETRHLKASERNNTSNESLVWNSVFNLPDWQYDLSGTGKTVADFADYQTVVKISESKQDIVGYTCTMSSTNKNPVVDNVKTEVIEVQQSGGGDHTQSSFGIRNRYNAQVEPEPETKPLTIQKVFEGIEETDIPANFALGYTVDGGEPVTLDNSAADKSGDGLTWTWKVQIPEDAQNVAITESNAGLADKNLTVTTIKSTSVGYTVTVDGEVVPFPDGSTSSAGSADSGSTGSDSTDSSNSGGYDVEDSASSSATVVIPPAARVTITNKYEAIAIPPLAVTKTADKAAAKVGETVNYTVTLANNTEAALTVDVSDDLAGGSLALNGSIAIEGADISTADSFDVLQVTIAANTTATLTYSAAVQAGASGTLTNTVTAIADGKSYTGTAEVTVNVTKSLAVSKTAKLILTREMDESGNEIPNGKVTSASVDYTVTLTNNNLGKQYFVQLQDVMQKGLSYVAKEVANEDGEETHLELDGVTFRLIKSGSETSASCLDSATSVNLDGVTDPGQHDALKENTEAILLFELARVDNQAVFFDNGDQIVVTYSATVDSTVLNAYEGEELESAIKELYNHVYATTWDRPDSWSVPAAE